MLYLEHFILSLQLSVLRGSVPDEAVQQSRGASTKNVSVKDVIDFVAPEVQLGCLKVAKADKKVCSVSVEHLLWLLLQVYLCLFVVHRCRKS